MSNLIINPYAFGAGAAPVLSHVAHDSDTTNSTAHSFTLSIGAAADDRYLVVAAGSRETAVAYHTDITIGGVMATELCQANPYGGGTCSVIGLWGLPVPAGTSAAIVVSHSRQVRNCFIDVWRLTGLAAQSPTDTMIVEETSTPNSTAGAIDVLEGGCLIVAGLSSDAPGTTTLSGVTQRSGSTETAENIAYVVGEDDEVSAETDRAVALSTSNAESTGLVAATFR